MTDIPDSSPDILSQLLKNGSSSFQTLINTLPVMMFVKDTQGRFVAANSAVARIMCAASPDDLIGKTDFDFYPEQSAKEYQADEQHILATGRPLIEKEEHRIDRTTGRKRLIRTTKIPIRDSNGKIVGIVGFGNDTTEYILAEQKLTEERNSLRTLIDNLPDYVYTKDRQSRFIMANAMLARHMGVNSPDDLTGKTDFDFYSKDIAASFFADEQEIIKTGKPLIQKDEINASLNNHTARVLTSKIPIRDTNGNITGIVGIGHDITALSKIEHNLSNTNEKLFATLEELKRTQEQIIQNERLRALGQMASGIAHDFNNSLTPILGYSDLILNTPGTMDNRNNLTNMIKDINTAAVDASQTVRRLREFYAPANKRERTIIDVKNLIETTLALTRPLWKEEKAAKGIDIQMSAEVADVKTIYGNESQLREMMTNLIFNSIDAMPNGGSITVKARREPPFAVLQIVDTGKGMSDEVLRKCFEPFFTTKQRKGSGLGLAMVHGIVRQHEGTIDIQSVEGKGTTITIRLPEGAGKGAMEKTPITRPVFLVPLKILLIDDEPIVRDTIETCLKADKHTIRTASEGSEGLALFAGEQFDVVITDRAMPGMSGDQVAGEIKKLKPDIPVIMLTGFGHLMKDTHEHPAGVDLIITKPITRESLQKAISKAIARKKR